MTRIPREERLALTVEEAAELAGVSRTLGYQMVRDGRWPSVRIGSAVRVPRRPFEAWFEEQMSWTRRGA